MSVKFDSRNAKNNSKVIKTRVKHAQRLRRKGPAIAKVEALRAASRTWLHCFNFPWLRRETAQLLTQY